MADDFRPHLLITEDDVETLENVKQERSKDLGLDRMAHGTKLSTDLQEIVSAYTRVQGTDSLRDEDTQTSGKPSKSTVAHPSSAFLSSFPRAIPSP